MYIGNPIYQVAFLTDQFSGNNSTTAFTMSVAPANTASVLIAVGGVLQDPSTYSVSGTTLTFTQAPPTGTGNISARYLGIPASNVTTTAYRTVTNFTATASQTTFTPPSYTSGFINVYRNGVYLPTVDYTATNGTTVVLNNGCAAGDTVTVESFLVSSVLNAIPATAGSVSTAYLVDGSVTQAKLSTNVAGNGPCFSAGQSAASQSFTNGSVNIVAFDAKDFDTANAYNNTSGTVTLNGLSVPAYSFCPPVAGYYQINSMLRLSGAASVETWYGLQKNASGTFKRGNDSVAISGTGQQSLGLNAIVYLNGTGDYINMQCQQSNGSTQTTTNNSIITWLQGSMVRSA